MYHTETPAGEGSSEPGPSVYSKNQEERIRARRLRITARNEAETRQQHGDETQGNQDMKEEALKSQLEHMAKLNTDGLELITNVQVAAEARESNRKTEQEEASHLRKEKLENEANASLEKLEEITHKWTDATNKKTPLELRDGLNSQQQLCEQILAEKNKLISELQQELKVSDDRYVKDLKRQAKDIDLLIERMEEQISTLKKSYQGDLQQIESVFDEERRTLLIKHMKKWENQMKERSEKELENMMQSLSLLELHAELLQKLRIQTAEENNVDKIRMDTEVQNLRKKVQEMKFNCHLNEEKLDYKYDVLKKREEENAVVKSQLKRKIIRMQDLLNDLKSKCAKQEKQTKARNQSLINEHTCIHQQYKDMQTKARHFAALDAERLEKLWLMYEDEAKALASRALETDRIIHEQQLGLGWISPTLAFMERSGPIQQKTLNTATVMAADALQEETAGISESEGLDTTEGEVDKRTVRRLLELLCDEMGFLVESKLMSLLSPLEKKEQSLIKLDAIFSAIGIKSEKDVYIMAKFFLNYRHHGSQTLEGDQTSREDEEEPSDSIHPEDLLVALKDFTAQYCRHDALASQKRSILGLNTREDSEDAAYWENIANVMPESKLKLWDALDSALHKYHSVLVERSGLLGETQGIQQENTELKQLLRLYTASKATGDMDKIRQFPV
ncbi:hypothetical protein DNTS_034482 [Danionella cerebrum]|uniref:Dynein regulatory complex protein 1 n=1 Tax=Danionella cerebrum TaxID=2873325 RepID=A0A553RJT1_9TELE|nr:hypothetical protein DNTS_034482 [Danionella translucida]